MHGGLRCHMLSYLMKAEEMELTVKLDGLQAAPETGVTGSLPYVHFSLGTELLFTPWER